MKHYKLWFFSFLIVTSNLCLAQKHLFNVTIQGNWDRNKDAEHAQFTGDNNRIYAYFSNFAADLLGSGGDISRVGQIDFTLSENGTIKDATVIKSVGYNYDNTIIEILKTTNGKWRPAEINGQKKDESLTIWYNIFKGTKIKSTLKELLDEIELAINNADYKKAIKLIKRAEFYDKIHPDVMTAKLKTLRGLQKNEEACEVLNKIRTFGITLEDESYQPCN